ncbi:MAG: hypothetical protein OM95_14750 [Bdellovibrio sp. ArHS]|uniref:hypothetical protein n=1 Tax=Bdellovibrio sp. ArHS TaxID=1569284 RepID=UPI000582F943|nr:hypothetical protein [Bdellovibrio sp. ArHS]KHD87359.1 MAG: hypothetical protein OM95_14750 [Bdellovibrio sp. ArHS]
MTKKQRALTGVAVAVGGVMLVMTSLSVKKDSVHENIQAVPKAVDSVSVPEAAKSAQVHSDLPLAKMANVPVAESAPIWKNYPYKKELSAFHRVHRKVFLNEDEKKMRQELLKDPRMISSLGELLQTPALTVDEVILQNVALDLLLESLREVPAGEAVGVLKDIVNNGYIEDSTKSLESRKSLGEVKAEILYQWSSLQPQKKSEIERLLPGPVSRKIWENVRYQQENNLAESALEQKGQ